MTITSLKMANFMVEQLQAENAALKAEIEEWQKSVCEQGEVIEGLKAERENIHAASKISALENRAELLAEDIECLQKCLDDAGAPRDDGNGNAYSMWGRVLRLINDTPNAGAHRSAASGASGGAEC